MNSSKSNHRPLHSIKGDTMKSAITALTTALFLASAPAFAMSHGGGKMDDKKTEKVDCKKAENKDKKECKEAPKK
jgi:hypothetical protein